MKPAYALVPRLLTPNINPGDSIEIEIFITGYGEVKKNKLFISYYSPLINNEDPGYVEYCIKVKKDTSGKILGPLTGSQNLSRYNCSQAGVGIILNEGYFLDVPNSFHPREHGISPIISEHRWDGYPPLLLKLNTSRTALPADYEISISFNYSDGTSFYIDQKIIRVHIRNWMERHGKKLTIIGIISTVLAIPFLSNFWRFLSNLLLHIN